jgi:1,4-dihydroxy-6-naphthoate synthase
MGDVQELNDLALNGQRDIIKVSYGMVEKLLDHYAVLPAGGALGFGVGPLLLSKPGVDIASGKIAVPGFDTTAFKVFSMFYPKLAGNCEALRFDKIMPSVRDGLYSAGLVIHEGRFTFPDYGLEKVADMGKLWEERFKQPLPLGAIVMKRSLAHYAEGINEAIKASIMLARKSPEKIMPFVEKYSDEMSPDVMKAHIKLYVNDYSLDACKAADAIADFTKHSKERVFII